MINACFKNRPRSPARFLNSSFVRKTKVTDGILLHSTGSRLGKCHLVTLSPSASPPRESLALIQERTVLGHQVSDADWEWYFGEVEIDSLGVRF